MIKVSTKSLRSLANKVKPSILTGAITESADYIDELEQENERLGKLYERERDINEWLDATNKNMFDDNEKWRESHMQLQQENDRLRQQNAELSESLREISKYPPFEETNNGDRFYEQMRDSAREVLRKHGLSERDGEIE